MMQSVHGPITAPVVRSNRTDVDHYYRRAWRYQRCNQNPYIEKRTDNTMAKRQSTKGQTMIYKTTPKTKDRVTTKNRG